jgi:hypothetical protein
MPRPRNPQRIYTDQVPSLDLSRLKRVIRMAAGWS